MPLSIQESLAKHGYVENPKEARFERYGQHIPYQELIGHTVDSFTEKAKRKGWLAPYADWSRRTP